MNNENLNLVKKVVVTNMYEDLDREQRTFDVLVAEFVSKNPNTKIKVYNKFASSCRKLVVNSSVVLEESLCGHTYRIKEFDVASAKLIKRVNNWEKRNRSYKPSQISDGFYDAGKKLMKIGTRFGNWKLRFEKFGVYYEFENVITGKVVRF